LCAAFERRAWQIGCVLAAALYNPAVDTAPPSNERRLRHTVVAFDAFLPEPEVERLYAGTIERERDFVASRTADEIPTSGVPSS
jgi:hypothetical protein